MYSTFIELMCHYMIMEANYIKKHHYSRILEFCILEGNPKDFRISFVLKRSKGD